MKSHSLKGVGRGRERNRERENFLNKNWIPSNYKINLTNPKAHTWLKEKKVVLLNWKTDKHACTALMLGGTLKGNWKEKDIFKILMWIYTWKWCDYILRKGKGSNEKLSQTKRGFTCGSKNCIHGKPFESHSLSLRMFNCPTYLLSSGKNCVCFPYGW
jgi:hypothetical protein